MVETAINEVAPIDTGLPVLSTSVVQLKSDYIRKHIPIQINVAQWRGTGSTTLNAQGDTGANTSATNNLNLIHDYREYQKPQPVGVFLQEETETILTANGSGYLNIVSDQGNIMQWKVVYTPQSNGTVLSPDSYHQMHRPEIFGFYQTGNNHNIGQIGFVSQDGKLQESITLKRNSNGQCMTTNINRVLLPGQRENKFIIRQVTTRAAQR